MRRCGSSLKSWLGDSNSQMTEAETLIKQCLLTHLVLYSKVTIAIKLELSLPNNSLLKYLRISKTKELKTPYSLLCSLMKALPFEVLSVI